MTCSDNPLVLTYYLTYKQGQYKSTRMTKLVMPMPHGSYKSPQKIVTKFAIRCVYHTASNKWWQIIKQMTYKNLNIVKKLVHLSDI